MNRPTPVRARVLRAFLSLVAGALVAAPASASLFSNVYVFGDSLLDVGNVYTATGGITPLSPPYYNGRWSNGPLAIDLFAANYGVTLGPSLLGGTNFAWGGARAESTAASDVPDTIDQVNTFKTALNGASADKNAIYVLDGGGNDIVPALLSSNPTDVLNAALAAMQQSIQILLGAGVQNILLFNVPDVGKTPAVAPLGPAASAGATFLTEQYNQGLALIEQGFDAQGFNVRMADLFGLNTDVFQNPGAFGFTNVTAPCLANGAVCANPDEYFYWDTFHPTAATGRLLAAELLNAVPEPGSIALFAAAFAAFAIRRRRTR
jgi:outer membrane lipase/esterase